MVYEAIKKKQRCILKRSMQFIWIIRLRKNYFVILAGIFADFHRS